MINFIGKSVDSDIRLDRSQIFSSAFKAWLGIPNSVKLCIIKVFMF